MEGAIEQILWENRLKIGALDWASNLCWCFKVISKLYFALFAFEGIREEVVAAGHTGILSISACALDI